MLHLQFLVPSKPTVATPGPQEGETKNPSKVKGCRRAFCHMELGCLSPKGSTATEATQWQSVRFSQSKSLSLFARQRSEECLKRISSKGSGSILQPSSNSQNVLRCIGGRIARWVGKQIRHGDGMRRLWRINAYRGPVFTIPPSQAQSMMFRPRVSRSPAAGGCRKFWWGLSLRQHFREVCLLVGSCRLVLQACLPRFSSVTIFMILGIWTYPSFNFHSHIQLGLEVWTTILHCLQWCVAMPHS